MKVAWLLLTSAAAFVPPRLARRHTISRGMVAFPSYEHAENARKALEEAMHVPYPSPDAPPPELGGSVEQRMDVLLWPHNRVDSLMDDIKNLPSSPPCPLPEEEDHDDDYWLNR